MELFLVSCLYLAVIQSFSWFINLSKERRDCHFPIAIGAVVLAASAPFILHLGNMTLEVAALTCMKAITTWAASALSFLGPSVGILETEVLSKLDEAAVTASGAEKIFPVAANFLVLFAFLVAKFLYLTAMRMAQAAPRLLNWLIDLINQVLGKLGLTSQLGGVKEHRRVVRWPQFAHEYSGPNTTIRPAAIMGGMLFRRIGVFMLVLFLVVIAANWAFPQMEWEIEWLTLLLPTYPALGIILFLELGWYMDGEENLSLQTVKATGTTSHEEGSYYQLWIFYQKTWQSKLLAACRWKPVSKEWTGAHQYGHDATRQFETKKVWNHMLGGEDSEMCQEDYGLISSLWDGDDILISDADCSRIQRFLNLVFRRTLMEGKKILVIVDHVNPLHEERLEQTARWIEETLNRSAKYFRMWKVQGFEDFQADEECDVLIASYRQLMGYAKINEVEWFRRLGTILIPSASRALREDVVVAKVVSTLCHDIAESKIQWILFDDPTEDAKVPIEWILPIDVKRLSMRKKNLAEVYGLAFKLEGTSFESKVFNTSRDKLMGAEAVLALPARQEGVNHIWMANSGRVPWDMNTDRIERFFASVKEQIISPVALAGHHSVQPFSFIDTPLFLSSLNRALILIRDEWCNLGKAFHDWSQCGHNDVLLVVVSKPYLLRDFFTTYIDRFVERPVSPLMPMPTDSTVNVAYYLTNYMRRRPMDSERLLREMRQVNADEKFPDQGLTDLIVKHFKELNVVDKGHLSREVEVRFNETDEEYEYLDVYRLPQNILKKRDTFVVMDIKENNSLLGHTLMEHVEQLYLPGQIHVFRGRPYQVRSINKESRVVEIRLKEDRIPLEYRHMLDVKITGKLPTPVDMVSHNHLVVSNLLHTDIVLTFNNSGYFEFMNDLNLETATRVPVSGVRRRYQYGRLLHYRFKFENRALLKSAEVMKRATFTLALLLNEVLPTFYPESHKFIHACSPYVPKFFKGFVPSLITDEELPVEESILNIYLVEDSRSDMGLLPAFEDKASTVFSLLLEYLQWLNTKPQSGTKPKGRVLWDKRRFSDHFQFLKFGQKELHPELELDVVRDFLSSYLDVGQAAEVEEDQFYGSDFLSNILKTEEYYCDYCGNKQPNASINKLDTGLLQCHRCANSAVESKDGLLEVLEDAKAYLKDRYGVQITDTLTVEFTTPQEIRKALNTYFMPSASPKSRVVGVARRDGSTFSILIENGAPYSLIMSHTIHELTHIWQLRNIELNRETRHEELELLEGHAQWVCLEYLERHNAFPTYRQQEMERQDVYGDGYRLIDRLLGNGSANDPFELMSQIAKEAA